MRVSNGEISYSMVVSRNMIGMSLCRQVRGDEVFNVGNMDWSKACTSTRNYTLEGARIHLTRGNKEFKKDSEACDIFSGRWVFDNVSYPLYNESDCPYMSDQLACTKHGRPDTLYQNWRWQPHGCNLKRYFYIGVFFLIFGKMIWVGFYSFNIHIFVSWKLGILCYVKVECYRNVGEIEREEVDVCRWLP